jgi:hypothetical protein
MRLLSNPSLRFFSVENPEDV